MKIDWTYPLIFNLDLKSRYKSLWLGWFLLTWTYEDGYFENFYASFQPGL